MLLWKARMQPKRHLDERHWLPQPTSMALPHKLCEARACFCLCTYKPSAPSCAQLQVHSMIQCAAFRVCPAVRLGQGLGFRFVKQAVRLGQGHHDI
jgi:hypothetical protein